MNSVILFLQKAKRKRGKGKMRCRRFCFYFERERERERERLLSKILDDPTVGILQSKKESRSTQ